MRRRINRGIIITAGWRRICNCGGAWPCPPHRSRLGEVAPRRAGNSSTAGIISTCSIETFSRHN